MMNMFSAFFVVCLGNNICEKYAFQQLHVITLKRVNSVNSACLLTTMLGFCLAVQIRSKEIFLLKYGIRELKASLSTT